MIEQRILNPITKLARKENNPRTDRLRQKLVAIGHSEDNREVVQLGSTRQVLFAVENITKGIPTSVTSSSIFEQISADHVLEKETSVDKLQRMIVDGEELLAGQFAVVTRPGKPAYSFFDRSAVWVPTDIILKAPWHVVSPRSEQ